MEASWLPFRYLSKIKTKDGEKRFIIRLGHPLLFHWIILVLFCALVLVSSLFHMYPLLAASFLLFLLAVIAWLWSFQALRKISFHLAFDPIRAFPDEDVELHFELVNGKMLPIPWLEINESIPHRLATGLISSPSPFMGERLHWTTSVSGRQRLRWRHAIKCMARGEYLLGPARIRSGDMFGFFPKEILFPLSEPLLVYPRILPVEELNLPFREILGEIEAKKSLHEDISRTVGPRDYRYGDPLSRIHWKASARQGNLQVRQYEATTSLNLIPVIDVKSFCREGRKDEVGFELAVTVAASLANRAVEEGFPVGLMADSMPGIQVPPSSDRNQLTLILEALARIRPRYGSPLHDLLEKERPNIPAGTTLAIITQLPSPALVGCARKLSVTGHSLIFVTVGEEKPAKDLSGIPVLPVGSMVEFPSRKQEEGL